MPTIEVTEEELERRRQGEVLDRLHEATVRGDEAEQRLWEAQLAPSAEILMRAKRVMGSDWLRRQAYDMRHAEEVREHAADEGEPGGGARVGRGPIPGSGCRGRVAHGPVRRQARAGLDGP